MTKTEYSAQDRSALLSALDVSGVGLYFFDFKELSPTRHLDNTQLSLILRDAIADGLVIREVEQLGSKPVRDKYLLTRTYAQQVEQREKYLLEKIRKGARRIDESTYGISERFHPDSLSVDLAYGSALRHGFDKKIIVDHEYFEAERQLKKLKDAVVSIGVMNSRSAEQGHFDQLSLKVNFKREAGKPARIPETARPFYVRTISNDLKGLNRATQMLHGYAGTLLFAAQGDVEIARENVDTLSRFYLGIPDYKKRLLGHMVSDLFEVETPSKSLLSKRSRKDITWIKLIEYIRYLNFSIDELSKLGIS